MDKAYPEPQPQKGERKLYLFLIICCAMALYVTTVVGITLMYVFYAMKCSMAMGFITCTLVMIVIVTTVSLYREQLIGEPWAILPCAVTCTYLVFLCWSALESNPSSICQPNGVTSNANSITGIVLGSIIASISLMWSSFTVVDETQQLLVTATVTVTDVEHQQPHSTTQVSQLPPPSVVATTTHPSDEESSHLPSKKAIFTFNVFMITASMYLGMLLTDWGTQSTQGSFMEGTASMWVKVFTLCSSGVLYLWTLIAPRVMYWRDFS